MVSCFGIIPCGGGSADRDDLHVPQSKSSKEKHGWSFRKKSTRQRVLSSSVVSETSAYGNKGSSESAIFTANLPCNSTFPEKASFVQCTEDNKSNPPASMDSKASENDATSANGNGAGTKVVDKVEESAAIMIQAAIRGFLAQRELLKLRKVVELQAALRGHLVRMSVSSAEKTVKPESVIEQARRAGNENIETPVGISIDVALEMADSEAADETSVLPESEENLITYEGDKITFHACRLTNPSAANDSKPSWKIMSESDAIGSSKKSTLSDANSYAEQPRSSVEKFASEQLETEGKKFTSGSKRANNPAFISPQSKFKELSPMANPTESMSSSIHHIVAEPGTDGVSFEVNTTKTETLPNTVEYAGSECGTELSISSTLDSPEGSEIRAVESELQTEKTETLQDGTRNCDKMEKPDIDAEEKSTSTVTHMSHAVEVQVENVDHTKDDFQGSAALIDASQAEKSREISTSNVKKEMKGETGHEAHMPSPDVSPRNSTSFQECQLTPSGQVSAKAKNIKTNKSVGSNQKRKPLSAGHTPPSNRNNHDSGARSSTEQAGRDHKDSKRRKSFSSDQEPRDSFSSNSLPRFMQATESARAKIHANDGSPRSSPDVQEKDIPLKKRHSLPEANGKHSSPKIQQGLKERKWQR